MNEQQCADKSSCNESFAAAHQQSGKKGIAFEAPVQFKLELGSSYFSKKSEDLFEAVDSNVISGQTETGKLYTPVDQKYRPKRRTKIVEESDSKKEGWITTRSDKADEDYYQIHDLKLYQKEDEDENVRGNDPERLVNREIKMLQFPKDHKSMPTAPSKDDPRQGELTDCTFISCLSGMAHSSVYNKTLQDNFNDNNSDGTKEVRLFEKQPAIKRKKDEEFSKIEPKKTKAETNVSVEMVFPYFPEGTDENDSSIKLPPIFSYAQNDPKVFENVKNNKPQPTWPMVYEAATAKLLGKSYTSLDDQQPETMLSILSGMQPLVYEYDDMIDHLGEVKGILDDAGVVIAVTKVSISDTILNPKGFTADHAYAVIAINESKLLMLNPNGTLVSDVTTNDLKNFFWKFAVLKKP
ncbi:MAG: hypothetical protein MUC87_07905 [Bacteroidia bacterium]|jgi:hypothetical protein|nr:hypothetical protein [Bacteroidia bacterium]